MSYDQNKRPHVVRDESGLIGNWLCALACVLEGAKPETYIRTPRTYLHQVLATALILCPIFLAVMGGYWLQGLQEDFPEESWWDPVVGFLLGFPVLFVMGVGAPFGLPQAFYIFAAVAVDGLFWAVAGVSTYYLARLCVQAKGVAKYSWCNSGMEDAQ